GERVDRGVVPLKALELFTTGKVPEPNRRIPARVAASGHESAIGRKRHREYALRVPLKTEDFFGRCQLPDSTRVVVIAGNQSPAIGRERNRIDNLSAPKGKHFFTLAGINDPNRLVIGADALPARSVPNVEVRDHGISWLPIRCREQSPFR